MKTSGNRGIPIATSDNVATGSDRAGVFRGVSRGMSHWDSPTGYPVGYPGDYRAKFKRVGCMPDNKIDIDEIAEGIAIIIALILILCW
jgi:hypothetical protein